MPKIRLVMNVAVDTKAHAQTIYDAIKDRISWFGPVVSTEDYYISFHLCTHDDLKHGPCTIEEEWRNGDVTWHNGEPVP